MVISSSQIYTKSNLDVVNINTANKNNSKRFTQNGQIQIYQSSYRGSYPSIISDSLRNAALGRKVLLIQFMRGGVKQGIDNAVKLCGNLTWVRSSHSFDQYNHEEIENNKDLKKSIHESTHELWNFCKKELLSGENDQIILDEIFLAIEMKIIDKDDLISTLENRFISGDVILTGTDIPKDLFLLFIKKFLIFSFLVFAFIIDKSSSITKSYFLKRTGEYLHFYNTLIHFLYQFCIKF